MIDWIKNYQFNSTLALFTYWIPSVLCLLTYACQLVAAYRQDLKNSKEAVYYYPTLTVGVVIGHLLLAIVPALNLFSLVFDCAPNTFKVFAAILDIPLVPSKPKTTRDN